MNIMCVPQTVKLQIKTWKNDKTVFIISFVSVYIWQPNRVLGVKRSHDHSMHFWIAQSYNKNILDKENGEQKMSTIPTDIIIFFVPA